MLDVVPAVNRGLVILRAILGPLHRPSQVHGGQADQRLVGVRRNLAPESATYLGRDDPEPVLGNVEHDRTEKPVDVWVLTGHPKCEMTRPLVVAGDRCSALHRGRQQPLLDDPLLDLYLGFLERPLRVSTGDNPGEGDVVRHVGVELGSAGLRHLLGIHTTAERFVIDVDQIDRVPRRRPGLRDTMATPSPA